MISTILVTSSDGIQFSVVIHSANEAQASAAKSAELRWAAQRTAAQLESFAPEYQRAKPLSDLIAPEEYYFSVAKRPQLTLIKGGKS